MANHINATAAAAAHQPLSAQDLLALERLRNLRFQREQRETAYMHKLLGPDAATKKRRLRLASLLSSITMPLTGAVLGGGLGALQAHLSGNALSSGAGMGALAGGGLGLLTSGIMGGVGSISGDLSDVNQKKLAERLGNLSADDYIIPGKASYLRAQLDKSFEENEAQNSRPTQVII